MRSGLLPVLTLLSVTSLSAQQPAVQMRDGGSRGVMESIYIPPIAHAPFNAVLTTEWSRPMGSGGSYTQVNRRRIVRDGSGRIYEERWLLVPKNSKIVSQMNYTQIADPVQHTLYNCRVANKTCYLETYTETVDATYRPAIRPTGQLANGNGYHQHEELGTGSTAGVTTTGYRETTTINPGVFGNDQPMITTREFWYAPLLGINLISKLDTPQTGRQNFTIVELDTAEPDPQFFTLPAGYAVVDTRKDDAVRP